MDRRQFLVSAVAVSVVPRLLGPPPPAQAEETAFPDSKGNLPTGAVAIALDRWTVAPRTSTAPRIDGRLDEEIWTSAARLSDFVTPYYLEEIEGDASVKLAFDDVALYLGIGYTDADEAASLVAVEVVIGNATGDFYRVPVRIRTVEPPFSNDLGPDLTVVEQARSAVTTDNGAVTAEVAVPFSALGDQLNDGDEWRINVILQHEMMTRALSSWVPIRTTTNSYNSFGRSASVRAEVTAQDRLGSMFLGALSAGDRPAAERFEPQNARLIYLSFTEKMLRFDAKGIRPVDVVRLEWKAPGADWVPVEDPSRERDDRQLTIRFGHPRPIRKGHYQLKIIIERHTSTKPDALAVITFDRLDLIRAGDSTVALPGNSKPDPVDPAPASEEVGRLIDWISDRTGFIFVGIPDRPALHPNNLYTWDPDDPDVLQSAHTDQRYPNHPDYPEDKILTVVNRLGQRQEYPYHEDADGNRFFLTAHLWFRRREHVLGRVQSLAEVDPLGAARVLYRFAEVYPGWVPTNEYPRYNRPVDPGSVPVNFYWGGVWSRWSASELRAFSSLPYAYQVIARTNAFDVLSEEVGEDVAAKIKHEMLEPSVDFYRSYVILYHNMDYTNAVGLIAMGKAFGDPSYIHETVEWAREYARTTYLFDGFYKENSLSYHDQATNGLSQVINQLAGWTDPDGYVSPRSGERFADLDLGAQAPVLANAVEVSNRLVYPDAKLFPMEDTWAYSTAGRPQFDAGSFLMPAGGVARLARGRADDGSGYFGIVFDFPGLEITDQSVPHADFPSSGTVQLEATSVGQSITFAFAVDTADRYEVDLQRFLAGSYGTYVVSIDDVDLGQVEFFGSGGVAPHQTIGAVELSAGVHRITFLGVGKHQESTNYKMGVVGLALLDAAAQDARDTAGDSTANPTQAYLVYPPKYGHHHYDPLSLAVFAEGQELLPDIGYTHTFYRQWTRTTLAHNTVVVDAGNAEDSGSAADGGNIEIFEHTDEAVQVMRAAQPDAYSQTSEYSREVWQIGFDGAQHNEGYLLDLFRVVGGDRHEYVLHGDANRDATLTADVELADYGPYLLPEGVEVTEPTTELERGDAEGHYYGYIYVRDVQRAELVDHSFVLDLATTGEDGEQLAGARFLGLTSDGATELFIGESPSLRATRLGGTGEDTNDEAVKYFLPTAVLRKEGSDLSTQFVTTIEPVAQGAEARIASIERLTPDQPSESSIVIRISYGDTTDLVLSSADPEEPITVGNTTLTGKLGLVRTVAGTVTKLVLIGGTVLRSGDAELTDDGPAVGTITGVLRRADGDATDAVITGAPVPTAMIGKTLVISHPDGKTHGYPIKAIEGPQIELDGVDPGFTIDDDGNSELQFLPFTRWSGETTFRIENQAST